MGRLIKSGGRGTRRTETTGVTGSLTKGVSMLGKTGWRRTGRLNNSLFKRPSRPDGNKTHILYIKDLEKNSVFVKFLLALFEYGAP